MKRFRHGKYLIVIITFPRAGFQFSDIRHPFPEQKITLIFPVGFSPLDELADPPNCPCRNKIKFIEKINLGGKFFDPPIAGADPA